mmetsp:Transcript_5340/g.13911  ORF Transcript_5340/g.13911 Transcript_5340/m.13911 type:complete len:325 (+) Transcript_5340:923-1897(+)
MDFSASRTSCGNAFHAIANASRSAARAPPAPAPAASSASSSSKMPRPAALARLRGGAGAGPSSSDTSSKIFEIAPFCLAAEKGPGAAAVSAGSERPKEGFSSSDSSSDKCAAGRCTRTAAEEEGFACTGEGRPGRGAFPAVADLTLRRGAAVRMRLGPGLSQSVTLAPAACFLPFCCEGGASERSAVRSAPICMAVSPAIRLVPAPSLAPSLLATTLSVETVTAPKEAESALEALCACPRLSASMRAVGKSGPCVPDPVPENCSRREACAPVPASRMMTAASASSTADTAPCSLKAKRVSCARKRLPLPPLPPRCVLLSARSAA